MRVIVRGASAVSTRPTPVPQWVEMDARFLTFEPHGNLVHN